eukprot:359793-Chlamydomonas_euryale.AAC.4
MGSGLPRPEDNRKKASSAHLERDGNVRCSLCPDISWAMAATINRILSCFYRKSLTPPAVCKSNAGMCNMQPAGDAVPCSKPLPLKHKIRDSETYLLTLQHRAHSVRGHGIGTSCHPVALPRYAAGYD